MFSVSEGGGENQMPLLPKSRAGSQLKIKQYPVEFNFWPVYQSGRRDGLESKLFVSNPWAIIRSSINSDCPASSREQALAFLEQAEYYFRTANNSDATAAKPVLLYYSFLNLVKAFVLKSSTRKEYSYEAYHGLKVKLGALPGTTPPTNMRFEEL
ncbi:MAG: YaaC family protein, partial [Bdellovibrionales bacterium]